MSQTPIPAAHRAVPGPGALAVIAGVLASLVAGSGISVQSRVNGALGQHLGHPYGAALISFGSGWIVCVLAVLALPAGRRGMRAVPDLLRRRVIPWWYLLAGLSGAYLVAMQTQSITALGVSGFILAMVVGQSFGGLAVDRLGIGPHPAKPLSRYRLGGTAMIVLAVFVAMLPRFAAGGGGAGLPTLIAMALLVALAGVLSTVQTAWNAGIAAASGTPITSTMINFTAGSLVLIAATAAFRTWGNPPPWHWPDQWWLYTGGLAGIVFIASAAVLAKQFGVLQTSLGMVTGMLLAALLLDVVFPTPTSLVTPVTVVGTLGTLLGLLVVTLPWRQAPRFVRRPR